MFKIRNTKGETVAEFASLSAARKHCPPYDHCIVYPARAFCLVPESVHAAAARALSAYETGHHVIDKNNLTNAYDW